MSKKQEPVNLDEVYRKALRLHEEQRPKEAIGLYTIITSYAPEAAEVHYNLGLAYFETNQFKLAAKSYQKAADLRPEDADIFYNLGLAYKKAEQFAEASEAYLQALALAPGDIDICYNLGCCCRDAGETEQAKIIFTKLIEQEPNHLPALNSLAYLHHLTDEHDKALEMYEQVLQLDPDHASASHMLAALKGKDIEAPPKEYIRSLFDDYSANFEKNLIEDLDYNLYHELRAAFDSIKTGKQTYSHALDLGCGTGLAGETFRDVCNILDGVDLSEKMIEEAKAKHIYDSLQAEDIITYLNTTETKYDLFIASDMLIYQGALQPVFEAITKQSTPDALFCLTTEKETTSDWILQPNGRYAHHPDYIKETAQENGWAELLSQETNGRKEAEEWVKSTLTILQRKN